MRSLRIALVAVVMASLELCVARAETLAGGNQFCEQANYDAVKKDYQDAAERFKNAFGTDDPFKLPRPISSFNEETLLDNVLRTKTILVWCQGYLPPQGPKELCDVMASPAYGPHRQPPLKTTHVGAVGFCAAAKMYDHENDAILSVEWAHAYLDAYLRDPKGFSSCGDDFCSARNFREVLNSSADTGLSSGKAYFCIGIGAGAELLKSSDSDYHLAVQRAREAWDDDHNGDAAHCLGASYTFGNGVPRDYAAALDWYKKAQSAGVDEGPAITQLEQLIASDSRPSTGSVVTGLAAGAITFGCLLWKGCSHAVGDFAWQTLKNAAQRKADDMLFDALKGDPAHQ